MNNFVEERVPQGESYRDLFMRVERFLKELTQQKTKTVAIVSHAGAIRSFMAAVMGLPLENSFVLEFDYARVNKVVREENGFKIKYLNF